MLASFVAVLIASFAAMQIFAALRPDGAPAAGLDAAAALLPWELAQQLVLAGVAVGGVAVAVPGALRLRAARGLRGERVARDAGAACGERVARDAGIARGERVARGVHGERVGVSAGAGYGERDGVSAGVAAGRLSGSLAGQPVGRLVGNLIGEPVGKLAELPTRPLVVTLLAIGLIGGLLSVGLGAGDSVEGASWGLAFHSDAVWSQVAAIAQGVPGSLAVCAGFAVLCLLTGVYEEAFLRVLGMNLFEGAFRDKGLSGRGALLAAALATSALFALLHMGVPSADAGGAGWAQVALRFVQTFSFAMSMAALFASAGRLAPCAVAHAGFDLLYLGPSFTLEPTYGSGLPGETVLLAVTAALLAGVAFAMWRRPARR